MKLGELKAEIRARKGNPSVTAYLPDGHPMTIVTQKVSLMAELDVAFGAQRNAETGVRLNDKGLLVGDGIPAPVQLPLEIAAESDDLDDLLG